MAAASAACEQGQAISRMHGYSNSTEECSERPFSQHSDRMDEPRPKPQAAVMPDGQVVMLSPDNPYYEAATLAQPAESVSDADSMSSTFPQFIVLALRLERMACVVRLLAIFDMVFSMTHLFVKIWPAIMAVGMSYCGYAGAKLFRRDLTRVYLTFLVVFAIAKVALCTHYLLASHELGLSPSLSVHLLLSAMVQLVIAQFVWRFYCLLPNSLDESRLVQHVAEHHTMASALNV